VHDSRKLVDRYVAIWNEPDVERRRSAVAALWTEDAVVVGTGAQPDVDKRFDLGPPPAQSTSAWMPRITRRLIRLWTRPRTGSE
jgi:hypothetical protein